MSSSIEFESFVWFGDKIIPASDALIKANSSAARFGLSVFEGIRGYFNYETKQLLLFRIDDHLDRLSRSAEAISLPIALSKSDIRNAILKTILANNCETDVYLRIDALGVDGESWHSTEPAKIHLVLRHFKPWNSIEEKAANACISKWIRIDSRQMPPTVKAGANYINSRYAYLDAKKLGFEFPILLNLQGNVSESSGAAIMCINDGILITPPLSAQVLDSITRDSLLKIASHLGVEHKVSDITKEQLVNSEEVFLCGTSAEITPILDIDHKPIGNGTVGPITKLLYNEYLNVVHGKNILFKQWTFSVSVI
jgi:branched-chain amino acid aminotransferase